jgi:hypothetical protein
LCRKTFFSQSFYFLRAPLEQQSQRLLHARKPKREKLHEIVKQNQNLSEKYVYIYKSIDANLMQLKFIICVNDELKDKLRYLIIDRLIIQVSHKAVAEVLKIGNL